jgi:hypothetical protein
VVTKEGTRPPRKREAEVIAALIGGLSYRLTAERLGVAVATVERIAAENRAHIHAARAEQAEQVAQGLRDRATYATQRLEDMLNSDNDTVVVSAIRVALTESLRWAEQIELTRRVTEIERRMGLTVVPVDRPYVR